MLYYGAEGCEFESRVGQPAPENSVSQTVNGNLLGGRIKQQKEEG